MRYGDAAADAGGRKSFSFFEPLEKGATIGLLDAGYTVAHRRQGLADAVKLWQSVDSTPSCGFLEAHRSRWFAAEIRATAGHVSDAVSGGPLFELALVEDAVLTDPLNRESTLPDPPIEGAVRQVEAACELVSCQLHQVSGAGRARGGACGGRVHTPDTSVHRALLSCAHE
jgi:hypothetical protein